MCNGGIGTGPDKTFESEGRLIVASVCAVLSAIVFVLILSPVLDVGLVLFLALDALALLVLL